MKHNINISKIVLHVLFDKIVLHIFSMFLPKQKLSSFKVKPKQYYSFVCFNFNQNSFLDVYLSEKGTSFRAGLVSR